MILIDQTEAHQRVGELPTADDLQIFSRLLLEPGDLLADIPFCQLRVVPLEWLLQSRREAVLVRPFINDPNGSSSGAEGQDAAKIS